MMKVCWKNQKFNGCPEDKDKHKDGHHKYDINNGNSNSNSDGNGKKFKVKVVLDGVAYADGDHYRVRVLFTVHTH
jgi:hypothetical protein